MFYKKKKIMQTFFCFTGVLVHCEFAVVITWLKKHLHLHESMCYADIILSFWKGPIFLTHSLIAINLILQVNISVISVLNNTVLSFKLNPAGYAYWSKDSTYSTSSSVDVIQWNYHFFTLFAWSYHTSLVLSHL